MPVRPRLDPLLAALGGAVVLLLAASGAGVFRDFVPADTNGATVLVLAVVGGLAGWAVSLPLRSAMRRRSPDTARALAGTVGAVLVAFGALAAIGAAPHHRPGGATGAAATTVASLLPSPGTTDGPPAAPPELESRSGAADVGSGLMGVVVAFGLAAIIAIMLTYRARRDDRRRRAPLDRAPEVPEPADVDEEAAARSFAHSARVLLDDPDPRRAVIAAYAALLDGLDAAGAGRLPHEAPEEHLRRALATLGIPADDAGEVTSLFLLARFSEHPVGEPERDRARRALESAERHLSGNGARR